MNIQSSTEDSITPAPLWRRFAAILYDSLLLCACYMLLGGAYVALVATALGIDYTEEGFSSPESSIPAELLQITLFPLILVFTLFFFTFFWIRNQRTLGMQTWKLTIQRDDSAAPLSNSAVTIKACLIRFLVATLSLAFGGLGYWWMLWDPKGKTWHDHASKTVVLYTPTLANSRN